MFIVDNYPLAIVFCFITMFCWGSWGKVLDRAFYVKMILPKPLYCLGKNKDGEPKHPLYLSSDTKLILYQ